MTPVAEQFAIAPKNATYKKKTKIPYAINADTQFYDGEEGAWRPAQESLLNAMIAPECETPGKKPGEGNVKPSVPDAISVTPAAASTPGSATP
ncbi:hypothetical protein A7T67_11875 [Salmonella enterica subsp. enterica serovar Saintpaul]|nr:hypothetical protein A7T67_11875 [Salmonella enterica subsp. enterica serovar Saintpaul]